MNNEPGLKEYASVKINKETGEIVEKSPKQVLEKGKEIVEMQLLSFAGLNDGKDQVENAIKANRAIENIIQNALVKDNHYGIIPGTKTKTLYQNGADILARTYGLEITYEIIDKTIDVQNNLIDYEYRAFAKWQGMLITSADASANSLETKFKSHFMKNNEIIIGKSAFDIKNTIQQMAQKRAMVRVIRKSLGIAGAFTQDAEELANGKANKDERLSIYSSLYQYKQKELGSNDTDRKNWLKLNILNPLCQKFCDGRNFNDWTNDDIKDLNEKLNDVDTMQAIIKAKLEGDKND